MTAQGFVVKPGEGRSFLAGLGHVKVETGAGDFSVFEQVTPVNPGGVPSHVHRSYDEAFFVLEGSLDFVVADERIAGSTQGTFVFVPRGVPHSFANPGPALARMLVIGSSGVQSLVEEVAPLVAAVPQDIAAINAGLARHDSAIVT
jgi:mannose-6-phosphate isomerase-like protein (cupin superfamily)